MDVIFRKGLRGLGVGLAWLTVSVVSPPLQAQSANRVDFGDRPFAAKDIVSALAPTRTRGLRLGTAQPSKVSMQLTFKVNSATLTPDAKQQLDVVAQALQDDELANSNIVISGHTDASGNPQQNLALSQRRADSVKSYLAHQRKIDPRRLTAVGRGSEEPLDDANPRSPINRRVELALAE